MPSMGSVGDCYDNAMAESFWATLEREVLSRRRFKTQAEAKMAIFSWIEGWYNPHRRHSSLGYRSPMNYERHALNIGQHERWIDQRSIIRNRGIQTPRVDWRSWLLELYTRSLPSEREEKTQPRSFCRLRRQTALWYTLDEDQWRGKRG